MRRVLTLAVAAALAVAAVAGARWLGALVLVVEDVRGGGVLAREPVRPGDVLALAYIHSSERVPVRGTFRVEPDGRLAVTETAFAGFGPGLPELRAGDAWRLEAGMIVHAPAGLTLAELRLRVAPLTRHRLSLPSGRELDLSALLAPGGAVRVRVARRGRLLLWGSSGD